MRKRITTLKITFILLNRKQKPTFPWEIFTKCVSKLKLILLYLHHHLMVKCFFVSYTLVTIWWWWYKCWVQDLYHTLSIIHFIVILICNKKLAYCHLQEFELNWTSQRSTQALIIFVERKVFALLLRKLAFELSFFSISAILFFIHEIWSEYLLKMKKRKLCPNLWCVVGYFFKAREFQSKLNSKLQTMNVEAEIARRFLLLCSCPCKLIQFQTLSIC